MITVQVHLPVSLSPSLSRTWQKRTALAMTVAVLPHSGYGQLETACVLIVKADKHVLPCY